MTAPLGEKGLVILDRDGVINRDSSEFVKSPHEWQALDGSIDAIAALAKAGFTVAVATNQSGLGRGLFDATALEAMHDKMRALVEGAGGHIDNIVVCPHGPDDGCECRKPKPGLLLRLGEYYGCSLTGVPSIGDSLRDIQASMAAGARPILVRTGNGLQTEQNLLPGMETTEVFDSLADAVAALLRE